MFTSESRCSALLCFVCVDCLFIYFWNSHQIKKVYERTNERTCSVWDEIGVNAVRILTIRSVIQSLRHTLISQTKEEKNRNENQNTNIFISVGRNNSARRVFSLARLLQIWWGLCVVEIKVNNNKYFVLITRVRYWGFISV